ncbi:unnamed protein product [Boreogadus saida]
MLAAAGVTSAPPAVPPGVGVAVRDEWRELSDSCCQGNSCLMQGSLTARCPPPGSRVDDGPESRDLIGGVVGSFLCGVSSEPPRPPHTELFHRARSPQPES